jgi:uncharacterized coiled-coil protein SlyX
MSIRITHGNPGRGFLVNKSPGKAEWYNERKTMSLKRKKSIPRLDEYIDAEGKKWVQTSTEDLFSLKELNEILETIDSDRNSEEIVLARIDFQKVNKEYYDRVVSLEARVKKQQELLEKVITRSKTIIDKKNHKLRELIEYIKKLHLLLAYINNNQDKLEEIDLRHHFAAPVADHVETAPPLKESAYENVEEIILPPDGSPE